MFVMLIYPSLIEDREREMTEIMWQKKLMHNSEINHIVSANWQSALMDCFLNSIDKNKFVFAGFVSITDIFVRPDLSYISVAMWQQGKILAQFYPSNTVSCNDHHA